MANWSGMRRQFWSGRLVPAARQLLPRTAFIGIRDLEIAVTVAEHETVSGRAFNLGAALHDWWSTLAMQPPASDAGGELRLAGGLGDYLLDRYESASSHRLRMHQEAFDRAFDQTEQALF